MDTVNKSDAVTGPKGPKPQMTGARPPSYRLTFEDAKEVWRRFWAGEFQNRIAAAFDVNPGRVNEVLKGRKHQGSRDAAMMG